MLFDERADHEFIEGFSCCAISGVAGEANKVYSYGTHSIPYDAGCDERRAYRALFEPTPVESPSWWNGNNTPENRECRVYALLLAAAMAETGDL